VKLYNYLTEQRSNIINIDNFVSNVKQKCKKILSAYQRYGFIYRGLNNVNPVLSIDSSKSLSRVSKNTANYYTILFDYVLSLSTTYSKRRSKGCVRTSYCIKWQHG
jgi:hypothetical protein